MHTKQHPCTAQTVQTICGAGTTCRRETPSEVAWSVAGLLQTLSQKVPSLHASSVYCWYMHAAAGATSHIPCTSVLPGCTRHRESWWTTHTPTFQVQLELQRQEGEWVHEQAAQPLSFWIAQGSLNTTLYSRQTQLMQQADMHTYHTILYHMITYHTPAQSMHHLELHAFVPSAAARQHGANIVLENSPRPCHNDFIVLFQIPTRSPLPDTYL